MKTNGLVALKGAFLSDQPSKKRSSATSSEPRHLRVLYAEASTLFVRYCATSHSCRVLSVVKFNFTAAADQRLLE